MNWPEAFVIVGIFVSMAFIIWAVMRYNRVEVEVFRVKRKEEKPDGEDATP